MNGERTGVMRWIKSRFPVDKDSIVLKLQEPVPGHLKRWYEFGDDLQAMLGPGDEVYRCERCQTLYLPNDEEVPRTGILLAFYYVPDPSQAYESVWRITHEISLGWWIRSLHKWSAN